MERLKPDLYADIVESLEILMKMTSGMFAAFTVLVATFVIKATVNLEVIEFKDNFLRLYFIITSLPTAYMLLAFGRIVRKSGPLRLLIVAPGIAIGGVVLYSTWLLQLQFEAAKNCEIKDFNKVRQEICIARN